MATVSCVINDEKIVLIIMFVHMLKDLEVERDLGVASVLDIRDCDPIAKAFGE